MQLIAMSEKTFIVHFERMCVADHAFPQVNEKNIALPYHWSRICDLALIDLLSCDDEATVTVDLEQKMEAVSCPLRKFPF